MAIREMFNPETGKMERMELTAKTGVGSFRPKGGTRAGPFKFADHVTLNSYDFEVTPAGVAVFDEVPGVLSGMDDDGLLFARVGRFMLIGIEHWFRYIHMFKQCKAGEVILDAACGYGELGKLMYTERFGCTYVGMDVAGKKLKAAAGLGWGRSKTMFIQKDLTQPLPFYGGTFDRVVSSEFIEHVMKPHAQDFLNETFRVTKPGGHLVLTTPNNEWGEVDPVHPNEYGYQEAIDMVTAAGWQVEKCYGLKLRGHVRFWDKEFKDDPFWKISREAYPSIFTKCQFAADRPKDSVFWSLTAVKPEVKRQKAAG